MEILGILSSSPAWIMKAKLQISPQISSRFHTALHLHNQLIKNKKKVGSNPLENQLQGHGGKFLNEKGVLRMSSLINNKKK